MEARTRTKSFITAAAAKTRRRDRCYPRTKTGLFTTSILISVKTQMIGTTRKLRKHFITQIELLMKIQSCTEFVAQHITVITFIPAQTFRILH